MPARISYSLYLTCDQCRTGSYQNDSGSVDKQRKQSITSISRSSFWSKSSSMQLLAHSHCPKKTWLQKVCQCFFKEISFSRPKGWWKFKAIAFLPRIKYNGLIKRKYTTHGGCKVWTKKFICTTINWITWQKLGLPGCRKVCGIAQCVEKYTIFWTITQKCKQFKAKSTNLLNKLTLLACCFLVRNRLYENFIS